MSDAPETKVELVRRSYALWNAGGVEALVEHVVAPDVVFYDIPDVPDTGIFRGVEAYADRLRAITEVLGNFQFEVGSIEERSDYTLATVELKGEAPLSGVPLAVPQFHISRWTDGRLHEFRAYLDADQAHREYERLSTSN